MRKLIFATVLILSSILFAACDTSDDGEFRTIVNNSGRDWYNAFIVPVSSEIEVPEYSFDVGTVKDGSKCEIDATSIWPYFMIYAKDVNGISFRSKPISFTGSEVKVMASDFD